MSESSRSVNIGAATHIGRMAKVFVISCVLFPETDSRPFSRHSSQIAKSVERTLTKHRFATTQRISSEILLLARIRQRRLQKILIPLQESDPNANVLPATDELQSLTALTLLLDTEEDCKRGEDILKSALRVTKLSLSLHVSSGRRADYSDECLQLVKVLFQHWIGESSGQCKLLLKCLTFQGLDFGHTGPLLPTIIDFTQLDELRLSNCTDYNFLLEALVQAEMSLEVLEIENSEISDGYEDMLDSFLKSFLGLSRLTLIEPLNRERRGCCDWSAVERHGQTLRSLTLDDSEMDIPLFGSDYYDRSSSGFRQLCSNCPMLEQIAIQTPCIAKRNWEDKNYGLAALTVK